MVPSVFQRSIGAVEELVKSVNLRGYSRTKAAIQQIKIRLNRRSPLFSRKLAGELDISLSSVQRIRQNDPELLTHKMQKRAIAH